MLIMMKIMMMIMMKIDSKMKIKNGVVDGGGCGLFLQWGVRCFWVEPFWVEMTQHNYSLELIIRGTAPSSVYISISCRSESSN